MAEKIVVCDECGKLFRVNYDALGDKELKCPSCNSSNVMSIYRHETLRA